MLSEMLKESIFFLRFCGNWIKKQIHNIAKIEVNTSSLLNLLTGCDLSTLTNTQNTDFNRNIAYKMEQQPDLGDYEDLMPPEDNFDDQNGAADN